MIPLLLIPSAAADWAVRPEHAALLDEARAALVRYDLDEASSRLDELLRSDPGCGEARWRLGQTLVHSHRPAEARSLLLTLQAEYPDRMEPVLALAWAGLASGSPDEVEVAATMAAELSPTDPEPALLLAWSAAASGQHELAQQRLAGLSDIPEAACVQARLAWAREDLVDAAVALSRCERIAPLLLARDTQRALVRIRLPQESSPDGPGELDLQLHVAARDLLLAERPVDALALLELLRSRYPRDLNTLIWMGRGYEMLDEPARAMHLYAEVLAADWRALYLGGRAEGVLAWTGEEGVRAGIANVARRQALLLHQGGETAAAIALLRRVEEDVGQWPALQLAAEELTRGL
jgi:tetratricopeptide (TPR) repeat protein